MGLKQVPDEATRILACVRKPSGNDLLDDLLNGFPKSVATVLKLRNFCVRHFGEPDSSGDSRRLYAVIDKFLLAAMSPAEFAKATAPAPVPVSRYKNVIEELEAESDIYAELERLGVIKLPNVSKEIKTLVNQMVAQGRTLTPADVELFQRMPRA